MNTYHCHKAWHSSLVVARDRIVLRAPDGSLLRRFTPLETMDLFAMLHFESEERMKGDNTHERYSIDGLACAFVNSMTELTLVLAAGERSLGYRFGREELDTLRGTLAGGMGRDRLAASLRGYRGFDAHGELCR